MRLCVCLCASVCVCACACACACADHSIREYEFLGIGYGFCGDVSFMGVRYSWTGVSLDKDESREMIRSLKTTGII